ncbi:MAG: Crp/Fnr family transcriptional regulator [Chitinophagaceae bacterium]|nr:MAG: Crp/Fnr family transcriptional regulator [Chitinophagaceae bacterium]
MSISLQHHITSIVPFSAAELQTISTYFDTGIYKKKANLLSEGQVCRQHFFVDQGLLRMYYIDEKGVEHTTQFALENWWLTDHMSFGKQEPSTFYIQAVENSTVQAINTDRQEELLQRFPAMEKYFRIIYQKAYAAHQFRIKYISDLSSEEMYNKFSEKNPEFANRIPQYLLASFLGFTPEYLSELRRKKMGKR